MKTGRDILIKWVKDYFGLDPHTAYKGGKVDPDMLNEPDHKMLIQMIDEALREAHQEGLDHKKQHKLLKEEGEHGPYWKAFLLKGCLDLPGVARRFNCEPNEAIWKNQWQEVIRVFFKKPTLRAVDPIEVFEEIYSEMKIEERFDFEQKHKQILSELSAPAKQMEGVDTGNGEYKAPWS